MKAKKEREAMFKITRRKFIRYAGMGATAASLSPLIRASQRIRKEKNTEAEIRLNLGLASYTFREFNLDQTIEMTKRLGLHRISLKSFHLPLESTIAEVQAVSRKIREAGIELYGCGVIYMTSKEEVIRAFGYAKAGGMSVIIGVPNHELLELLNSKAKEFGIKAAIHNHGPGDKLYPTPESVFEKIKSLDPRIGLCLDVGHTERAGIDPCEAAEMFADRLLDVHIKDVTSSSKEGVSIEIGRGVIDIPKFLRTLLKIKYSGTVAFEYEKDEKDPLPGAAESVGYVRGALSVIQDQL